MHKSYNDQSSLVINIVTLNSWTSLPVPILFPHIFKGILTLMPPLSVRDKQPCQTFFPTKKNDKFLRDCIYPLIIYMKITIIVKKLGQMNIVNCQIYHKTTVNKYLNHNG
jgi:hypothetical protein